MKKAFLFPGQGAQYVGMGKDLYQTFAAAKEVFDEADEQLQKKLSKIAFEGPQHTLTETKNSQLAIYVMSVATLRVLEKEFGLSAPNVCAGLSLGEYTALTAAMRLPFSKTLRLVEKRAQFMNEACEKNRGAMAVVIGLADSVIQDVIRTLALPNDIWIANYNCPGQVVISGTERGIIAATEAIKAAGAKRILPLTVHGAFHSGLMQPAQDALSILIDNTSFAESAISLVMNVTGSFAITAREMQDNLKKQITGSVRWHQGICAIEEKGIDAYFEIGCGNTLAGMNKRIAVKAPTFSIGCVADVKMLEQNWRS